MHRVHTTQNDAGNATSNAPLDRRRFLGVAATLAAATASTACGTSITASAELARPELLGALGASRVRALGARYREMTPAERDADSLRSAIVRSMPWSARMPWSGAASTADLVHQDFEAGRTVTVLGWILSATEARQCALFSLLPA
jgi:hypothetical protein